MEMDRRDWTVLKTVPEYFIHFVSGLKTSSTLFGLLESRHKTTYTLYLFLLCPPPTPHSLFSLTPPFQVWLNILINKVTALLRRGSWQFGGEKNKLFGDCYDSLLFPSYESKSKCCSGYGSCADPVDSSTVSENLIYLKNTTLHIASTSDIYVVVETWFSVSY